MSYNLHTRSSISQLCVSRQRAAPARSVITHFASSSITAIVQKWQNVWVRGDPRACVSGFVRVCEGNSLVPSLSPCLCVVRVCWSYREFCAAVHYSSVSQAEQCSPSVPDLKTLPRGCVCMRTHTSALCICAVVCVNVMPLFPSTTCSGVAGGPDQAWGNGKDYLLFLQRH